MVGEEVGGRSPAQPQRSKYQPGVEALEQAKGQVGGLGKELGLPRVAGGLPCMPADHSEGCSKSPDRKFRKQPVWGWEQAVLVPSAPVLGFLEHLPSAVHFS